MTRVETEPAAALLEQKHYLNKLEAELQKITAATARLEQLRAERNEPAREGGSLVLPNRTPEGHNRTVEVD